VPDHADRSLHAGRLVDNVVQVAGHRPLVEPVARLGRVSRAAVVGHDHAIPGGHQRLDRVPPRPPGLRGAVDEQDDLRSVPGLDVVHAHTARAIHPGLVVGVLHEDPFVVRD